MPRALRIELQPSHEIRVVQHSLLNRGHTRQARKWNIAEFSSICGHSLNFKIAKDLVYVQRFPFGIEEFIHPRH